MTKKSEKIEIPDEVVFANVPLTGAVDQRLPSWLSPDWFWALILMGVVILAYQSVWQAGFMWDDDMIVTSNPCIVGPFGLKEIWTTSMARFYPFVLTTFWLEHKLWGLAPLPYHLVNILLQALCGVVLWRVLRNLEVRGAWLGAALWALHPVQVETVAWISEMKNTESCLFYLLTILFFVKGLKTGNPGNRSDGNWTYALALLCGILATASKSSTLLLPVVLALCSWWVRGRCHWRDLAKVAPFLLITIVAGAITMQILQRNGGDELHWAQSWPERLITAGNIFWCYLGKLLWPHPLMTLYPSWEIDAGQWTSYLPIVAVALVLIILWLKRQSWSRPYFFAFAYYLATLLPVMGLFSMSEFRYSLVEDHLQYLASMGPLALAGAGLTSFSDFAISRRPWLRSALCAGLLFVLGLLSWRQAWFYQNPNTLWTYDLAQNPNCWLAYSGLGVGFAQKGQVDKAIEFYQKSLAINPTYTLTHDNLGQALVQKGQTDEAIAQYQEALAIDPNFVTAYYDLGLALLQKGQADGAIEQFQRALKINPNSVTIHYNLGLVLLQTGQVDRAIEQFQMALKIDPNSALAHDNLGAALFHKGQVDGAIEQFQMALKIDPNSAKAHNNLGMALGLKGRAEEALDQFQTALAINPDYAEAHNNLGIAFAKEGRLDEALAQFQEALRLKPDDNAAQIDLVKIKAMIQQKAAQ
jgi:protein O-mannosyl-transferase